jgi:dipeptidyl aminopeptidase/acylaminoacyl peptidase
MPASRENPFIEKLVDSFEIDEVSISPCGQNVAYTVKPFGHKPDKKISSLWLADVGILGSSRQLTSGHNDFSIKWSPGGTIIAFLSNIQGESFGIYGIQPSEIGEDSISVKELYDQSKIDSTRNISKFYWSPDSQRIALLAPDKKDPEEKKREESGDDVEVYGTWKFTRPYLLDMTTLEVRKVYSKNTQVEMLVWSPDGSQILLVIHQTPELDSPFYSGIQFETISVHVTSTPSPTFIADFPGPVLGQQPVWASTGEIFFLAGASPRSTNSSMTLYCLRQDGETWSWSKYSHGDIDCVMDLRSNQETIFGQVQSGLSDEVHILSSNGKKTELVLYFENEQINTWDVKFTQGGGYVLALSKSNTLNPLELFTVHIDGSANNIHSINDMTNLKVKENTKDKPRDPSANLSPHAANLTQITHHNQDLANSLDIKISS